MSDERPNLEVPVDPDSEATVLELFGVKLTVNNPRLAEILTMDAKEALAADIKDLVEPAASIQQPELRGSVPDIVVTSQAPQDAYDQQAAADFEASVEVLGSQLGFDVEHDGVWNSPTGATVVVRAIDQQLQYAAATDFVQKLDVLRTSKGGPDAAGLFVTADQPSADVFKVAIRQARLYGFVRTVTVDSLVRLSALVSAGSLDHAGVLVVLLPFASADANEIVSLLESAEGHV